ncbi:hypothetical protein SEA_CHRIDISON_52 [Arthrobacter phage Chridison]|uniref:Uncharacterized protein n=2 Tax=Korravirus hunterdalle TaxID=1982080 RepID=A0A0U4IQH5_9CAUD|nr:hypothetical protein FDH58_gp55 [Arthrobacter phage HunterDalle]ALY09205.1 hypothetical protein HUNTERDALLE_55 [Arthrobacter phage HunterDalle]ALY10719.1 hypothetical protein VULTURE_55 [Arthrobacter phage Vulture]WAB09105.1 hypothetical protein SEA_CHRIDISON_52 [Arthrobacter phage Chridison]
MYDPLFEALIRRMNVEQKAEQVKVRGAKDPMVTGIDLNDDATRVRHDIRGIAYAGRGWLGSLGGDTARGPGRKGIAYELRYLARNVNTLDSDSGGADKMRHWGQRVVAARIAAENLLTPDPLRSAYFFRIEDLGCEWNAGEEENPAPCGGRLGVWMVEGQMVDRDFTCANNPGHVTKRETAIRNAQRRKSETAAAAKLIQAILGKGAVK